jgi:hypothetical protein
MSVVMWDETMSMTRWNEVNDVLWYSIRILHKDDLNTTTVIHDIWSGRRAGYKIPNGQE